jgi:hypothetical protein
LRSFHPKKTRDRAPAAARVLLGTEAVRPENNQERAFLVGIEVRTRGRSGAKVTAQAQAAREAAQLQPAASGKSGAQSTSSHSAGQSNGHKPAIPEFDARWRKARAQKLSAKFCSGATGPIQQL